MTTRVPRPPSVGPHPEPDVLVVVVTFNSADVIEGFLSALPEALSGIDSARVVVVDNASSDRTLQILRAVAPWVTVRSSGGNLGYAAGINVALREFRSRCGVLLLNPDAVPAPGTVVALLEGVSREAVGIAVPRIVDSAGRLKYSLRREPTLLRAVGEAVLGGHRAARFPVLGDMIRDPAYYVDGARADWATGAAMMLRRQTLDDVGLWDESFFLYSEETEFALRARDLGWDLHFVARAEVAHPGGDMEASTRLWTLVAVNRVRLYRNRHNALSGVLYWVVVLANEAMRARRPTHRAALRALVSRRAFRNVRGQSQPDNVVMTAHRQPASRRGAAGSR